MAANRARLALISLVAVGGLSVGVGPALAYPPEPVPPPVVEAVPPQPLAPAAPRALPSAGSGVADVMLLGGGLVAVGAGIALVAGRRRRDATA